MRLTCSLILGLCLGSMTVTHAQPDFYTEAMQQIAKYQEGGFLDKADATAKQLISTRAAELSAEQRRALEYEIERSRRIARDYSVTEERLRERLKGDRGVESVTDEEIDQWIADGLFDRKKINGEIRYVGPSAANLYFRNPDIRARRKSPSSGDWVKYLLEHTREIREEVSNPAEGLAEPRDYRLTMTIAVREGVVPEGETIRCWMPFPQQFQAQSAVRLLTAEPEPAWLNAPDYPMRSIYFEAPSAGAAETRFTASYEMTVYPRRFELDPERVAGADQTSSEAYEFFTAEEPPHIVFSQRIRNLAAEITAGENNPMLKARRIYDWIADNLKYSYAREYSTLRNIPEYVLDNGYGDCGQIALTFITLCRASGVPARWQSGWVIYPKWSNLHDWTEIYLAPYGWTPVDPDFAMGFQQSHQQHLSEEEIAELQDFYFGGMDAHRLTINRRHGFPHYPAKDDFRSDNVDFQRGELEAAGKNIYFGDFWYDMDVEHLYLGEDNRETAEVKEARPADPGAMR